MGQRLYTPASGRFLQTDPVPGGSANDYDYCNQDPVNCYDLSGQVPVKGPDGGNFYGAEGPAKVTPEQVKELYPFFDKDEAQAFADKLNGVATWSKKFYKQGVQKINENQKVVPRTRNINKRQGNQRKGGTKNKNSGDDDVCACGDSETGIGGGDDDPVVGGGGEDPFDFPIPII